MAIYYLRTRKGAVCAKLSQHMIGENNRKCSLSLVHTAQSFIEIFEISKVTVKKRYSVSVLEKNDNLRGLFLNLLQL